MRILLCAATELELRPTLAYLEEKNLHQEVEVLITGVGLVASTYSLAKRLAKNHPGLVIQTGVAGALNEELILGQVVVVGSEIIGDEGVAESGTFHSLFALKLADAGKSPYRNGKLLNNHLPKWAPAGLPVVHGVSVNQISTNGEQIDYYRDHLGADIETMEGAALHYVAGAEGVPFLQLRAISNYVGERNKSKWVLREAIEHVNRETQNILTKLLDI
ncbi:MAG TPA: futalosine hydrolase [Chitinophagaceae bacterium]